jgi:hypothetical protein|nr:MAG TPA: excisionase [Caudoviricetes sp.]
MEKVELITVAEAARLAECTENAVRYQLNAGKLTRYENGTGKIRVNKNELLETIFNFKKI